MLSERLRIRDIRNTSTFRLTMMLGLVFALGVAALLGLIYGLTARELNARSDHILKLEAAKLQAVPAAGLRDVISAEIARSTSGLNYFGLQTARGAPIAGNILVPSDIRFDHPFEVAQGSLAQAPLRLIAIRTSTGQTIIIGRDITPTVDLRRRVLIIMVGSGIGIALLVLNAAIALSVTPLRRVRDLQRASRKIASGNLAARMPVLGRGDELDLLAATVNTMIEEISRILTQVRDVTDAIAHDLRTPLARARSQLSRVRQPSTAEPQFAAIIDAATTDLEIVLDRFSALMRISELEAGRRRAAFRRLAIRALIVQAVDLYEPLAAERSVALTIAEGDDAVVEGDESLLFEVVCNLVDNAIKFAPVGGEAQLSLRVASGEALLSVCDNGPGIPADERKLVLHRFYRGTNAADVPGSGIGLSLVAAIVQLHGFTLELGDANPGLIATIRCKI